MSSTEEQLRRLLALAAYATLGAVYLLEHGWGFEPCALCLTQRIPWWILLGITLIVTPPVIVVNLPRATFSWASFLLLMASAGLGAHHFSVEQGWIEWDAACGTITELSFETFKDSLTSSGPVVSCTNPQVMFLNLSLSGWNAIVSTLLALVCLACAGMRPRRR